MEIRYLYDNCRGGVCPPRQRMYCKMLRVCRYVSHLGRANPAHTMEIFVNLHKSVSPCPQSVSRETLWGHFFITNALFLFFFYKFCSIDVFHVKHLGHVALVLIGKLFELLLLLWSTLCNFPSKLLKHALGHVALVLIGKLLELLLLLWSILCNFPSKLLKHALGHVLT